LRWRAAAATCWRASSGRCPTFWSSTSACRDSDGRDVCRLYAREESGAGDIPDRPRRADDRLSGFNARRTTTGQAVRVQGAGGAAVALVRRPRAPGDPPPGLRLDRPRTRWPGGRARDADAHRVPAAGRPGGTAGEVVRRRSLVASAWPDGAIVHDNTLDASWHGCAASSASSIAGRRSRRWHGVGTAGLMQAGLRRRLILAAALPRPSGLGAFTRALPPRAGLIARRATPPTFCAPASKPRGQTSPSGRTAEGARDPGDSVLERVWVFAGTRALERPPPSRLSRRRSTAGTVEGSRQGRGARQRLLAQPVRLRGRRVGPSWRSCHWCPTSTRRAWRWISSLILDAVILLLAWGWRGGRDGVRRWRR